VNTPIFDGAVRRERTLQLFLSWAAPVLLDSVCYGVPRGTPTNVVEGPPHIAHCALHVAHGTSRGDVTLPCRYVWQARRSRICQ